MLCSKCYKRISPGEEIQKEGSLICKECAVVLEKTKKREVVACCHTCHWEIYRGDLIHEDSGSFNVGLFFLIGLNVIKHKRLTQCQWCHQRWLNEKERGKKWGKHYKRILGIGIIFSLCLGTSLFYFEGGYISLLALLPLLFLAIVPLIRYLVVEAKRYKFRKRNKNN